MTVLPRKKNPYGPFTISELAAAFGVTTRTIRYYEECGLLASEQKPRPATGCTTQATAPGSGSSCAANASAIRSRSSARSSSCTKSDLTQQKQIVYTLTRGFTHIQEIDERIEELRELREGDAPSSRGVSRRYSMQVRQGSRRDRGVHLGRERDHRAAWQDVKAMNEEGCEMSFPTETIRMASIRISNGEKVSTTTRMTRSCRGWYAYSRPRGGGGGPGCPAFSKKASFRWRDFAERISTPENRPYMTHYDGHKNRIDRIVRPYEIEVMEKEVFSEGIFSRSTLTLDPLHQDLP